MPSPRLTWQWRREGRGGREGEGGTISQTYLVMVEGGERGEGGGGGGGTI